MRPRIGTASLQPRLGGIEVRSATMSPDKDKVVSLVMRLARGARRFRRGARRGRRRVRRWRLARGRGGVDGPFDGWGCRGRWLDRRVGSSSCGLLKTRNAALSARRCHPWLSRWRSRLEIAARSSARRGLRILRESGYHSSPSPCGCRAALHAARPALPSADCFLHARSRTISASARRVPALDPGRSISPTERFWPGRRSPGAADDRRTRRAGSSTRCSIRSAAAPVLVHRGVPAVRGPDYDRAMTLARASREYREVGSGEGSGRARFQPEDVTGLARPVRDCRSPRWHHRVGGRRAGAIHADIVAAAALVSASSV